MSGFQDAGLLLAFYFHILTTMHGQNHIKFGHTRLYGMLRSVDSNRRFATTYSSHLQVVLGMLGLLELLNRSRREEQVAPKLRKVTSSSWTALILIRDGKVVPKRRHLTSSSSVWLQQNCAGTQWRTQEFFSGGSINSAEDRDNGDLGLVAP